MLEAILRSISRKKKSVKLLSCFSCLNVTFIGSKGFSGQYEFRLYLTLNYFTRSYYMAIKCLYY